MPVQMLCKLPSASATGGIPGNTYGTGRQETPRADTTCPPPQIWAVATAGEEAHAGAGWSLQGPKYRQDAGSGCSSCLPLSWPARRDVATQRSRQHIVGVGNWLISGFSQPPTLRQPASAQEAGADAHRSQSENDGPCKERRRICAPPC